VGASGGFVAVTALFGWYRSISSIHDLSGQTTRSLGSRPRPPGAFFINSRTINV